MILGEPKVEFVELDMVSCASTSDPTGGGQYCKGSQLDAQGCADSSIDIVWN